MVDLDDIRAQLAQFPGLHFMMTSTAPILTSEKLKTTDIRSESISETCLKRENFFVKLSWIKMYIYISVYCGYMNMTKKKGEINCKYAYV